MRLSYFLEQAGYIQFLMHSILSLLENTCKRFLIFSLTTSRGPVKSEHLKITYIYRLCNNMVIIVMRTLTFITTLGSTWFIKETFFAVDRRLGGCGTVSRFIFVSFGASGLLWSIIPYRLTWLLRSWFRQRFRTLFPIFPTLILFSYVCQLNKASLLLWRISWWFWWLLIVITTLLFFGVFLFRIFTFTIIIFFFIFITLFVIFLVVFLIAALLETAAEFVSEEFFAGGILAWEVFIVFHNVAVEQHLLLHPSVVDTAYTKAK